MTKVGAVERREITIRGAVQGVGFRPFVHNLAAELHLSGYVQNRGGQVQIEVEGPPFLLDRFLDELNHSAPRLAAIDQVSWTRLPSSGGGAFCIARSETDAAAPISIPFDVATCSDCLAELFDPMDRRFGYPFSNCTQCGPRLTIVNGAPYDRERTTMATFPMCDACRAEYENPSDRRFHAQPTACPACGPRLRLLGTAGEPIENADPLGVFAQSLRDGGIGAIKGLGGYRLMCDARSSKAVGELRRRKHRDEKPFAIMVQNASAASLLCEIGPLERRLLESPLSPIVLLRKSAGKSLAIAGEVAPGNPRLGVMLPHTPLDHLLMRAVEEAPLVASSGNRCDEPIACDDQEALERLGDIADLFLTHDRPIHCRCDDSVTSVVVGPENIAVELPIRRSRGYVPQPIRLPFECGSRLLAVGGQSKATFALGRNRQAFLSQHLGDLHEYEARQAFECDVALFERLFVFQPQRIAHDLHPDYASTEYARRRASVEGLELVAVQHHHAHMASCMAEHGLQGLVIGVTFDGSGWGADGAVWGGEFLVGDYRQFRRAAHLRYVGMPGAEQAVREPWRMAAAHLLDAGCNLDVLSPGISPTALAAVDTMIARRVNTPFTSSAGRLFDAVAALAGGRQQTSYEGQAAMECEWLASESAMDASYPYEISGESRDLAGEPTCIVDTRPLIRGVARDKAHGAAPGQIARRFHSTLAEIVADVCSRIADRTGLDRVVLSGGVFSNALLTVETAARLDRQGLRVYRHQLVPPNDGGLSLGQLAVAAAV